MTRPPPPLRLGLVLLTGWAGLAGCAHRAEHRYFQPTAAQIGPEPNSYGEVVLPRHGLVAVQGGDFAYGLAQGRSRRRINGASEGQSPITVSETLRRVVRGVKIENRGFPGDTAAQSAVRWADAPPADLTILSLGTGDAEAATSPEEFRLALRTIINADHARGGAVFLVIPPSSADLLQASKEAIYRAIARQVGQNHGAVVFDADASMLRIKHAHSKTDAQAASVYQAVAADMAPYIKVVAAPSPQTGQAGSRTSRTVRDSADRAS